MTRKEAPTIAQFAGYKLIGDKIWLAQLGYAVAGARAEFYAEPSRRGPSAGRAFVGLILGAVLGLLVGLLVGGYLMIVVGALVLGLVMGLTQTEHAKSSVVVTWPATNTQLTMEDSTDQWEAARYMAQEINRAASQIAEIAQ